MTAKGIAGLGDILCSRLSATDVYAVALDPLYDVLRTLTMWVFPRAKIFWFCALNSVTPEAVARMRLQF
jgi:hypothetical protein